MISPMTARKGINIVDGFHPQISASVCYTIQICTPQVLEIRKAGLQLSKRKKLNFNYDSECFVSCALFAYSSERNSRAKTSPSTVCWIAADAVKNGKMERGKWQNGRMAK
ncbi:hypothetical protein POVCU2_0004560 [Plasmodium ovale curtisi]|uniref:Uncharacterized protein n=1 Tax=Plasmodium ovale curtisi TaxID=864141 RepID=A0A1A8VKW5_PLAOA|nr:hypothetical protein POVCU2_0004560 [Plasmodium ovale curtisi]